MKRFLSLLLCLVTLAGCITVVNAADLLQGDMNENGSVASDDAIYLLRHTLNPEAFPIGQSGDVNGDGRVNSGDAIYLLRHTLMPQLFPLKNGFAPVLRFVVASDLHVNYSNMHSSIQTQNVRNMISQMNAYAASGADGYDRLDAIVVAGDLTDHGRDDEFAFIHNLLYENKRSETQILATMGNHDWNTFGTQALDRFEGYFGKDTVMSSQKLGDYYLIRAVASGSGGFKYTDADYARVEEMIEAAIADTGTEQPIFLSMHIGPRDTVASTDQKAHDKDGTSEPTLKPLFEKYENLVVFCGHSHFPANDEFSVWQDDYTVINTGSLTWVMRSMADWDWIDYEGHSYYDHAENYLVEMDENGRMRLRVWNIQQGRFVGEDRYFDGFTKEDFAYTLGRYTDDDLFFAQDAEIEIVGSFGDSVSFTFPVVPESSLSARAYEVSLLDTAGEAVQTRYYSAPYFNENYDQRITASLSGMTSNAEYTVSVRAVNSQYYLDCTRDDALRSKPLTMSVHAGEIGKQDGTADVIDLVISGSSLSNGALAYYQPEIVGSPTFQYDESIGKDVVSFNGSKNDIVRFNDYSLYAAALQDSMTMEFYFKLDEMPKSGYVAIISSQQGAGFGLEVDSAGVATFFLHDGTEYKTLKFPSSVSAGAYYHVTAVFDGAYLYLYVNGIRCGSVATAASMIHMPTTECRRIYLGGDVTTGGGCEAPATCTVAGLRLYSYALTSQQVYAAYRSMAGV